MQIIVSEKSFFNHLRQIENIDVSVTDEELSVRAEGYIRKLAAHVRNNFGVDVLPRPEVHGKLATLTASIKPSWDEESVATRLAGLQWLVPVAVTLEWADIPAFVYEPMMRAAIQEQFAAFSPSLQRLTVGKSGRPLRTAPARYSPLLPLRRPTITNLKWRIWNTRPGWRQVERRTHSASIRKLRSSGNAKKRPMPPPSNRPETGNGT